jgi:hypothetical protein
LGIEKTFPVIDSSGNLVKLPHGTYFCYDCNKLRKIIFYPYTGTIEPCDCGSKTVHTT